jgi:peptidyl-prolyl cis-trans isomerase A (cyclophilin A)
LAPKACANFIGLATGQRAWLEQATGRVRTNHFYDGSLIVRILPGLIIQGGSPDGLPSGDPGYVLEDEFDPGLRHDAFGALSVANTGRQSGGSQFFITMIPAAPYNDRYTMFGRVIGGSNVVYAINQVATDGNQQPLTNVIVQSVMIRRIGAAAEAFDIHAQGHPVVTDLNLQIAKAGTNVSLTFSNRLNVENRLFASANLAAWTQSALGVETVAPATNSVLRSTVAPVQFFRMAQVQYPTTLHPPRNVLGRTVTLVFTNGVSGTMTLAFSPGGGGVYNYNGSPGNIYGYQWGQEPYNGRLWPLELDYPLNVDLTLNLTFDTALAGGFAGTVYPYYYPITLGSYPVGGSFSLAP